MHIKDTFSFTFIISSYITIEIYTICPFHPILQLFFYRYSEITMIITIRTKCVKFWHGSLFALMKEYEIIPPK